MDIKTIKQKINTYNKSHTNNEVYLDNQKRLVLKSSCITSFEIKQVEEYFNFSNPCFFIEDNKILAIFTFYKSDLNE